MQNQHILNNILAAIAAALSLLPASVWCRDVAVTSAHASAGGVPLPGLDADAVKRFERGRTAFESRWVVFPSGGGHWGLGPQSSAESCTDCHRGSGRGHAPDGVDEAPVSLVLWLSVAGIDSVGGPRPHPAYGEQLNNRGVLGKLIEEGEFRVRYDLRTVLLGDGERVELRAPRPMITALWFGPLGRDTIMSLRLARPLPGVGLLEQVPASALQAIAAQQRESGMEGRINRVWDFTRSSAGVGRFGHKASQPSLRQQAASALITDMGVTTALFPFEDCWPAQRRCYDIETVSGVEARKAQLDAVVDYLRLLAPPPQPAADNPDAVRGARLFEQARCAVCHVPSLPLADGTRIHPYTDLLLHDLGEALADGRSEYLAGPRDWRTPPLWGIGLSEHADGDANYLHDGRARGLVEAILWHGGEAQGARDAFAAMQRSDRDALLAFLRSL